MNQIESSDLDRRTVITAIGGGIAGIALTSIATAQDLTPKAKNEKDPCIEQYSQIGSKDREIHVNLGKDAVRVYTRKGAGFTVAEFANVIYGPVTKDMARDAGWCHMHVITSKLPGPTTMHQLLNFAVFCPERQIGFHSDLHLVNGKKVPIPGTASAGCIRIPHAESKEFFDSVNEGDCVRLYEQASLWRLPTFAAGSTAENCKKS